VLKFEKKVRRQKVKRTKLYMCEIYSVGSEWDSNGGMFKNELMNHEVP
jgi:hypothetical protein